MNIWYLLQKFADWITYQVFDIPINSLLGNSINFFIFDTLKIFILLIVIIFAITIIRTYLPPEKIKNSREKSMSFDFKFLSAI